MAAKLTRLTHKIVIQLHLVAESYIVCNSRLQAASPETFGYTPVRLIQPQICVVPSDGGDFQYF